MSSCDDRGLFAADKEMARRRSLSREPQAMPACESLIQRSSCVEGIDAVSRKKAPGSAQTNVISVSLIYNANRENGTQRCHIQPNILQIFQTTVVPKCHTS